MRYHRSHVWHKTARSLGGTQLIISYDRLLWLLLSPLLVVQTASFAGRDAGFRETPYLVARRTGWEMDILAYNKSTAAWRINNSARPQAERMDDRVSSLW